MDDFAKFQPNQIADHKIVINLAYGFAFFMLVFGSL